MDELLIKMNEIVKSLNETFEIDPVIVEDGWDSVSEVFSVSSSLQDREWIQKQRL